MKKHFSVFVLTLLVSSASFADSPSSNFDLKKYQDLIERAGVTGEHMQSDIYEWRVLSRIVPNDKTSPRHADYFTAIGGADSMGKFHTIEISMVSENWRKATNGNWEAEQWMWSADKDGTLTKVMHTLLIENASGDFISDDSLPAGLPSDSVEIARWHSILGEWFASSKP